jgi:hypothetical protein
MYIRMHQGDALSCFRVAGWGTAVVFSRAKPTLLRHQKSVMGRKTVKLDALAL